MSSRNNQVCFSGGVWPCLTFFAGFDLLQDFGIQGFGCHFLHGFSFLRIQLLGSGFRVESLFKVSVLPSLARFFLILYVMVGFRVASFRVSLVLLLMVQIFGALCLWALAVTILKGLFFYTRP